MSIFPKLNKRRIQLLKKIILRTRVNGALIKYSHNRINNLFHDRYKTTRVHHPTNFMLELGNVCNLHCKMCPREHTYGQVMDKGFMDLENAYKIIDEIYPFLDSIGLTGLGETFLYPHLLEVVKYIKQKKKSIIITVSTNAHIKNYIDIADKFEMRLSWLFIKAGIHPDFSVKIELPFYKKKLLPKGVVIYRM